MKAATIAARLLLGVAFTVFGANFFFHFIPMPPMPKPAQDLAGAMYASGYLMHVAHALELIGGLLLLSGFFVPLALTLLGPVLVNIVLFDTILAPSNAPLALILAALEVFLIWRYGSYFRPVFTVSAASS
jgi:putative oxidoreductase